MRDLLEIARFVAELTDRDMPPGVRAHCEVLVADSVACTIGALQTPEGKAMARALSGDPGAGFQHPSAYGLYASSDLLAGVTLESSLANLLDFDDTYEGSGHVGCVVVPVALRLGSTLRRSGVEVLTAAAAGFEAGCRLLQASRPGVAARAQVWGIGTRLAPAAAAVAARLLRLAPEATAHAMAMACCTAPVASVRKTVYGQSGVTWVKNNVGAASAAGVTAALLAREGGRGPLDILDGGAGFGRMIGTDFWQPSLLSEHLGTVWEVERLGLKPYPCCRHMQAVLDAGRLALHGLADAGQITGVAVAGPVWIYTPPFTDPAPRTMLDAQFSLPYCLALALLDVESGLAWFDPVTFGRRDVRELAARVRTEGQPGEIEGARVTIYAAGRSVTAESSAPRGSPASPLPDEERQAKFMRLVAGAAGASGTQRIYDDLHDLARWPDLREVTARFPAMDLGAAHSAGAGPGSAEHKAWRTTVAPEPGPGRETPAS